MRNPILHTFFIVFIVTFISTNAVLSETPTSSCERYKKTTKLQSLGRAAKCLTRLSDSTHESEYEVCKTRPCFLFIRSSPIISFDTAVLNESAAHLFQSPFPCNNPGSLHPSLSGIAFELLRRVTKDSLCIWAGPVESCTFNALVEYTAVMAERGYQFAITGLLLDMPMRRCNHLFSAPILDSRIVIIGRREDASNGSLHQLVKPFRLGSWLIIVALLVMFLVVVITTVMKMKAVTKESGFHTVLRMFTGDKDLPDQFVNRITRYTLSMTLLRFSLALFLAVFALFYEAAVVNFLFQQGSVRLSKSLKLLSKDELGSYAVLKNSALEVVWNDTVNKKSLKYSKSPPWKRCKSGHECVQWVANNHNGVQFAVTYEAKGRYLIQRVSSCEKLTIIETRDELYHFSSGWLYTRAIPRDFIESVDHKIVLLRMRGELSRLFEHETGDTSCIPILSPDIGPSIIAIPFGVLVLPFLFGSLFVLCCWGRQRGELAQKKDSDEDTLQTSSASLQSSSLSQQSSQSNV